MGIEVRERKAKRMIKHKEKDFEKHPYVIEYLKNNPQTEEPETKETKSKKEK